MDDQYRVATSCLDEAGKMILPGDSVLDENGNSFSCIQWGMGNDEIVVRKNNKWATLSTKKLIRTSPSNGFHALHRSHETLKQLVLPFMYGR